MAEIISIQTATSPAVALDEKVVGLLSRNCVVAVGVSGGKDSVACALAVNDHLNEIGHTGPRVLVHADLGVVEWQDSLPTCERLAARIGWELLVVRRRAGDMMDRWEGRWVANLARYQQLATVKIILPWSTPAMRFCTGELKVDVITRELRKRFISADILNVTGIRRQESTARGTKPISSTEKKLERGNNAGVNWNAIIEWDIDQVFRRIEAAGLDLHEAYTKYGSTRVSCVFCIMGSIGDMVAAASCPENKAIYNRMVELEAHSTFAFQGSRWLADVAPDFLSPELMRQVQNAKQKAVLRQRAEARIPAHLLFVQGVPTYMPSQAEAILIADVRRDVSSLLGVDVEFTSAEDVIGRYADLIAAAPGRAGEGRGVDRPAQGPPVLQMEMSFV